MTDVKIRLHADDYGMTVENTDRITELIRLGGINGVSIMPNGCLEYAAEKIRGEETFMSETPVFLHINLVEGRAVTGTPVLTDERGYFKYSFGGLLLSSLINRRRLGAAVYAETMAQLRIVTEALGDKKLAGLDSHQHVHMIPEVFRAVVRAAKDFGLEGVELRFPTEPILPYIKHISLWRTFKPSNIVKNIVLNFMGLLNKKTFEKSGFKTTVFCGLVLSGRMDCRLNAVLPDFIRLARRKGQELCVLFHPGYILEGEPVPDKKKVGFVRFHRSGDRITEYKTALNIKNLNGSDNQ